MIRTPVLAGLALVLVHGVAHGQQTATGGTPAAVNDSLFAAAAASGGLTEVTISEIGLRKATDPELKRFSQQMVDEHNHMNQQLTNLAATKGIELPKTIDARVQFCAQNLAGLSGEKFDECYAKAQLLLHMESVATFEAEAQRGQDPEVKALAAKSLLKIKEHLNMIKPIAKRYHDREHESNESR